MLAPYTLKGGLLFIPDGDDEKAIFNLASSILPWLELGAAYAWEAEEMIWNAKVQVIPESGAPWRPALVLGTGSVRAGGSDQSAYAQLFKKARLHDRLQLALSGGLATDVPDLEDRYQLFNAILELDGKFAPFYSYDGNSSHVGAIWYARDWLQITGYALEMAEPAISMGLVKRLRE